MIGAVLARRAVAGAFDALNRHDLAKFMAAWRDDGIFIYPGEIPESGTFTGRKAVESWFQNFLAQFPKIQFDLQDICVKNTSALSGTNVVITHWNLQLSNQNGRKGSNSGVTVITIEGSKVIRAKDYIFDLGENFRLNWRHESMPKADLSK